MGKTQSVCASDFSRIARDYRLLTDKMLFAFSEHILGCDDCYDNWQRQLHSSSEIRCMIFNRFTHHCSIQEFEYLSMFEFEPSAEQHTGDFVKLHITMCPTCGPIYEQ